jgi:hypothetical protein
MTTGTQVTVVPANFQLPAHLQTAEAAAAIAAYNAAAAGGIKIGGFPRISIKGSKFHVVKGGETTTIMAPAAPGQPPLPMMILESVIVSANPQLSKTYYAGEYQPGDDKEPDCSADNGTVPDSHIVNKQSPTCATCPQNQWGSKISKTTGKDVKACSDTKRLALLPAADLKFEALGLSIPPASLGDWGKYVKALSERNIPVNAIVTNITFDATASYPKLLFSFNRVLTAVEYATVAERAQGDDVKNIVSPVRQIALPQLAVPTPAPAAPPHTQVPPPPPPAPPAAPMGFGAPPAAPPAAPAAPVPTPTPEKPKRAPRKAAVQQDLALDPLAHLPPEVQATVRTLGLEDPLAQALIAKYSKSAQPVAAQDTSPVAPTEKPVPAAAPVTGFGGAPVTPVVTPSTTGGLSLKDQLAARLRQSPPPATPTGQ